MNSKPKVGTVVQIVKSDNRYNAWDADGNKWTHALYRPQGKIITIGASIELREKNGTQYLCAYGEVQRHSPFPPTPLI